MLLQVRSWKSATLGFTQSFQMSPVLRTLKKFKKVWGIIMATNAKKLVNKEILQTKQASAARALNLFALAVTSRSVVRSENAKPISRKLRQEPR